MKDFNQAYVEDGAYHHQADGFRAWFLADNYLAIKRQCVGRKRILDLGCGEGCLAGYISDAEIDGVDYSDRALALNRELFPGRYRRLFRADLASLGDLDLTAGSYDCIVCSLTLMYLDGPNLRRCLDETLRLLAKGGIFVVTYPTVGPHRQGSADAAEVPPAALKTALEDVGYRICAMEPSCPFLPASLVEQSKNEETRESALGEYIAAAEQMKLENSYHFLIVGEK
jgi:SAM-dependent methyltransferase